MSQPESRLSRQIKAAIRARGGYCVKIHGGPMMEAGTPDILACIPVQVSKLNNETRGLFVGIETKMPEGVVSAVQQYRHAQIRQAGGVVIIPRSVEEAVAALESLGMV